MTPLTRLAHMAGIVLVVVGPVLGQEPHNSAPPTVAGFRLGVTWAEVASSLPCRVEALWAGVPNIKVCDAADTVQLGFIRDTLFDVVVTGPARDLSPTARWNLLREWTVGMFGKPDSVVTRPSGGLDWITARWGHGSARSWRAWIQVGGRSPGLGLDPGWSDWMLRATHCRLSGRACQ
jgi:hypothetical protein